MLELLVWPVTALLAYTGTVWTFRTSVKGFLDKAESVEGPGGVKIASAPRQQIATDPEAVALPSPAADVRATSTTPAPTINLPPVAPLIQQVEDGLRHDLVRQSPDDQPSQLATALRALAHARLLLAHEANYRVIFGTQIMLLKSLNDGSVASIDQARFWYDLFHQRLPDVPITFESWLQFLTNCGYVRVGSTNHIGTSVTLTLDPFGRDFLLWITHNGISESKPG